MIISCVALNINGTKPSLSAVSTIQEEPTKIKQKKKMSVLLWLCNMYKHILKSQTARKQSRLSFCALKPYYANDIKVSQSMLNTPLCKCEGGLNETS